MDIKWYKNYLEVLELEEIKILINVLKYWGLSFIAYLVSHPQCENLLYVLNNVI